MRATFSLQGLDIRTNTDAWSTAAWTGERALRKNIFDVIFRCATNGLLGRGAFCQWATAVGSSDSGKKAITWIYSGDCVKKRTDPDCLEISTGSVGREFPLKWRQANRNLADIRISGFIRH
jgi:hypothetical protein